MINKYLSPM